MVDIQGERSVRKGEAVLLRADNKAAVAWVKSCRGGGRRKQE